jgi:ribosomal protein L9
MASVGDFALLRAPVLLVLAVILLASPGVRATMYKWVDDQGVVHYTDKLPPEAVNKGSVELSKQGITLKKNDPALTPEQRRAKEAEEERARQAAKARDELLRKDRALLQTYTTESEIDLARTRALGTINGQVQSAQAYSTSLNKRKADVGARIAALGDKPVPPALTAELTNINDELTRQADLIAAKHRESAAVSARYDADKQRWHEIRTNAETEAAASASPAVATGSNAGAAAAPAKK